jgi:hypothetical protein
MSRNFRSARVDNNCSALGAARYDQRDMYKCPRTILLIIAFTVATLSSDLHAEPVQAPNSRVKIDLPVGYSESKQFSGFINQSLGASFVIAEFPPEAYDQISVGMTPAALASKGMQNAVIGKLVGRSGEHTYIRAEQDAGGIRVQKFMLILKEPMLTALVTANIPQAVIDGGRVDVAAVNAVLASVTIATEIAPSKNAFSLGYLGPFQEAATIVGFTKLYSLDGMMSKSPEAAYRPVLLVTPSIDKRPIGNLLSASVSAIHSLPSFSEVKLGAARLLKVGSFDAVEQEAIGQDSTLIKPLSVYQLIVALPDGGYLRVVGIAPTPEMERLKAEYPKIARSVRPIN